MGKVDDAPAGPGSSVPTFADAAREAAASIESLWSGASLVVVWVPAEQRVAAITRSGTTHDLGSLDLRNEADVLDAVGELVRVPRPGEQADRQPSAGHQANAVAVPMAVGGRREGVLCLLGASGPLSECDLALLAGIASLLATIRDRELQYERLTHETEMLRNEARTDPLTQLLNRRGFLAELERHCEHSTDPDSDDVLLLADVRGLKEANDRYGHSVGDQLLIDVADAIRAHAGAHDVIGRFGGDEFAVIVCGESARVRANTYAAEVQSQLDGVEHERPARLTVAFGEQSLASVESGAQALERADNAMYRRM